MGLFPDWQEAMHGVPWEGEWVFNVPATMIEPGSGVSYGVHHVDWLGMEGMPDWATATSFDAGEAMEGEYPALHRGIRNTHRLECTT